MAIGKYHCIGSCRHTPAARAYTNINMTILTDLYICLHTCCTYALHKFTVDLLKLRELEQLSDSSELSLFAGLFHIAGRCFDMLENRPRAVKCFHAAIDIDVACVESIDYMIQNSLLSRQDISALLNRKLNFGGEKSWLRAFHQYLLADSAESDSMLRMALWECPSESTGPNAASNLPSSFPSSTTWLVQNAEYLYDNYQSEEAYRLSRQAYSLDPFNNRGLLIYIASMVDLNLKTELFYLGHELSHAYPKLAISWYAIGCYYWCCKKLELAQKFLQKCTKLDKRFSKGWIVLGVVLSAQEESEHAISAFRAATRLLPGDYRPLTFMSKELVRTCNLSLAQHLLHSALELNPQDPIILNELGVILLKNGMLSEALSRFKEAIALINSPARREPTQDGDNNLICTQRHTGCEEIYNNYATCLRKCGYFDEALMWYERCLGIDQNNANTHANIAFTLHVSGDLDKAISSYHRALSIEPTMTICADMMSNAIEDFTMLTSI